jgi:hypothetical protein
MNFYPKPRVASLKEQWRPITGFDIDFKGYFEVSNFGRVRGLNRFVPDKRLGVRNIKEKIYSPTFIGKYASIVLIKNNVRLQRLLHTIVAFAWIEPCPGKYGKEKGCYSIDHIDRNPQNNNPHNLQWLLVDEHCKQGMETRKIIKGDNHVSSRLTEKEVIEIRQSNLSYKELAAIYNISYDTIVKVIKNISWKHVPYPNQADQINSRKNGARKLSKIQIQNIIDDKRPQRLIASIYGISQLTVSSIKRFPSKYLSD